MTAIYNNLKPSQFFLLAIVLCAAGDIAIATMIYHKFAIFENFVGPMREMFAMASAQNPTTPIQLTPALESEVFQLMRLTVIASLVLVFVVHGIIYLGFWFQKSFCYYYVKMMSWIGPLFCFFIGLSAFTQGELPKLYFFLQFFFYLFVAIGLQKFKLEEKAEA